MPSHILKLVNVLILLKAVSGHYIDDSWWLGPDTISYLSPPNPFSGNTYSGHQDTSQLQNIGNSVWNFNGDFYPQNNGKDFDKPQKDVFVYFVPPKTNSVSSGNHKVEVPQHDQRVPDHQPNVPWKPLEPVGEVVTEIEEEIAPNRYTPKPKLRLPAVGYPVNNGGLNSDGGDLKSKKAGSQDTRGWRGTGYARARGGPQDRTEDVIVQEEAGSKNLDARSRRNIGVHKPYSNDALFLPTIDHTGGVWLKNYIKK